ncbi:hypothetical protein [Sphingomonas sp. RS2018]
MLADLSPLMTDVVIQLHAGERDIVGNLLWSTRSEHLARVTYSPGKTLGPASREASPDATATMWLIDHPHPIAIGNMFELSEAVTLKVARFERRKLPDGVLHKVYLT